jgi:hypothetical protein
MVEVSCRGIGGPVIVTTGKSQGCHQAFATTTRTTISKRHCKGVGTIATGQITRDVRDTPESFGRFEQLATQHCTIRAVLATRAAIHQELGQEFPKDLLKDEDKADLLLHQEKYDQAAPYFANKTDLTSRVKYALCLSYSDPEKALQIWNDLEID